MKIKKVFKTAPSALVFLALLLPVATLGQSVSTSKISYEVAEPIVITFSGGPGNAKDWIGLYKAGQIPGAVGSTKYLYVDGSTSGSSGLSSGSVTFPQGLVEEGEWTAFYLENDGYVVLASAPFSVANTAPTLEKTAAAFYANQPITLSFRNGPGNPKDWVGIYKAGETPGDTPSTLWFYVDGTRSGAVGHTEGTLTFDQGLPPGDYVAQFLLNDGYQILASLPFSVLAGGPPQVLPQHSAYLPDEPITISFANGPGNPKDWVGVYFVDQVPGEVTSTLWSYVGGSQSPGAGLERGEVTVGALPFAGEYNAFLLLDDGYSILASNRFSVVDPFTPLVRLNKRIFAPGEDIVAEFINGPGNPKDWLGIYPAGETPDGDPASLRYFYVDGTTAGAQGLSMGTVTFAGGLDQPGNYAIHFLIDDGYTVWSTETFSVTARTGSGVRIVSQSPASNATNHPPNLALRVALTNDFASLNPASVRLTLDGQEVMPKITPADLGALIEYDPGTLPASGSAHTYVLSFSDDATPPAETMKEIHFTIGQYQNIVLPAPIYFNDFDSVPEGQLPSGWSEINFTDSDNDFVDFEDLNSAAYKTWTTVDVERFRGPFITYSNPDNPESWATDYQQRVLLSSPFNVVNGKAYTEPLASGRFLMADSGYRNGTGQIMYLFTPDFDLTGQSNVYLSFHSLWEQNQDSLAAIEYSIDRGQSWLPVAYFLDGPDIVSTDGAIDAVATFNTSRGDIATYLDPITGEMRGGTYGAFIAAPVTAALAPYLQARVNDDPVESKRIELFRLPAADQQAAIRIRFAHAGADSWYWGIDDFGLYAIAPAPTSPELAIARETNGQIVISWTGTGTLEESATLAAGSWTAVTPAPTGNSITVSASSAARKFYRVRQ